MTRAALRSGGAPRLRGLAALSLAGLSASLCALLAGLPAGPARAEAVRQAGGIMLRYSSAPLTRVAEEIAQATGQRLIVDPGLPGRLTITIGHPITADEALAVLDAALLMQGYATLRGPEGFLKVMPIQDAATGSRWAGPGELDERQQVVTTMVKLERASAENVALGIRHLVSANDMVVPYPPTNSLILSGIERRLRNLIELARALDADDVGALWVRTLRHRDALEVLRMLEGTVGGDVVPGLRSSTLRMWADERSSTLILLGPDDEIADARKFVEQLDQPPVTTGEIQVVRIHHRPAKEIADQLLQLAIGRTVVNVSSPTPGEELLGKPFFAVADVPTNTVVISASPEVFATIRSLIDQLDRAPPRIQVDVTVYEISNPSRLRIGVDWFLPVLAPSEGNDTALTIGSNPSGGGLRGEIGDDLTFFGRASRDPLLIPFIDGEGNVVDVVLPRETVVVTAFNREVRTRVLMQPSLLMVSGEEQRLFSGENVPIPVGQTGQELSGVQTISNVERQDVGVELRLTPTLGMEGKVRLELHLELSRVTESIAGNVDVVGPTLEDRRLDTEIFLSDGEFAVIGMSQEATQSRDESGAPFLKDIPILGHAVKSGGSSGVDTHIVFAVQVKVLRSHAEDLAESIRQRLALERSQSRVSGLRRSSASPWAVLVSTRSSREEAESLAASFERDGAEAQVGAWRQLGEERFDVYLTGYTELGEAGDAALRLRERGFAPQVVVMPGETALATPPALRMLGSSPGVASASGVDGETASP
jgi:general secretion pathway protein D